MSDNEVVPVNEPEKRKSNQFVKGQSGNPAGRPKGSISAITAIKRQMEGELRAELKPHLSNILNVAVTLALAGDREMIRLLLDKSISPAKASDEDDSPKEKIQILIGRLDNTPADDPRVIKTIPKSE